MGHNSSTVVTSPKSPPKTTQINLPSPGEDIAELVKDETETEDKSEEVPLMILDVNITPTLSKRIEIFEESDPKQTAIEFGKVNNLSDKMVARLENMLRIQIEEAKIEKMAILEEA